jgi:hypothetical protein
MRYFILYLIFCPLFFALNLEDETKNSLRPIGEMLHEIKEKMQEPFTPARRYYHFVKADTIHQIAVANGRISRYEPGVALPDRSALGRRVKVYLPDTERFVTCRVVDVGPWFTRDPYWKLDRGPLAEKTRYTATGLEVDYRSGISLTPETWRRLGVSRDVAFGSGGVRGVIGWRFVGDYSSEKSFRRGKLRMVPQDRHMR